MNPELAWLGLKYLLPHSNRSRKLRTGIEPFDDLQRTNFPIAEQPAADGKILIFNLPVSIRRVLVLDLDD